MGKVKDTDINSDYSTYSKEVEMQDVEQDIVVGDTVLVYDSSSMLEPKRAVVLYSKTVGDDIVHSVQDGKGALMQVYDIQCRKVVQRVARILWVRFKDGEYEVSGKKIEGWVKFRESL